MRSVPNGDLRLEALLIQGVDPYVSDEEGGRVASLFRRIPTVAVQELRVGKLGNHDTAFAARAMKMRVLINLRLASRRLSRVARQFQPNVVYSSQQFWDLRIATPLSEALRRPQIIHRHHVVVPWPGRGTTEVLRRARMVIGVSNVIRDDAVQNGVPPSRACALYNSIDVPPERSPADIQRVRQEFRAELAVPDDALLVDMAGRINVGKGQEDLVRAMLPIFACDGLVHLVVAGAENPAGSGIVENIRRIARDQGTHEQVHLFGYRTDVPRLLEALDIFAHPSRSKPFGLAILEAMAHGLPVVAWREGGLAEIVVHRHTGFLAEPMDIQGLTHALHALTLLLADAPLRQTLGTAGRRRVTEAFSSHAASSSFLSVLQDVKRDTAHYVGHVSR